MVLGAACGDSGQKQSAVTQALDTAAAAGSAASPSGAERKAIAVFSGPRIVIDSLATEPLVAVAGNEFVVHLPQPMAQLLYDSLPGFSAQPQSSYSPGLVGERKTPMAVVAGDFDGDSRRDLAMVGVSENTPVLIMLLANSQTSASPKLVFLLRPKPNTPTSLGSDYLDFVAPKRITSPDDTTVVLDLHADAVNIVGPNVSEIAYLDHGVIRWFSVVGD